MTTIPERYRVGFGLIGILVVAGLIAVSLAFGRGYYDDGYEVSAVFPSSSQGLFTDGGSSVKVRGIDVGHVSGIELLDDGRAEVTMFVREGIEIADTTTASIEPLSIFGPKFVNLDLGEHETTGPFLVDGGEIAKTSTQRELSDILATTTELLEAIDPQDLVVTIDAVAEGLAGMGPQIGRTIDASGVLAEVAARHTDDLRRFLADAALLSQTFAAHGDDLLATARSSEDLLSVLTEQPGRLDDLLRATTQISSTFADLLADNAESLDATLRSVSSFIAGVHVQAASIPDFLDLIGTFFGRLSDVIRFDGPSGTRMAGLRGFISTDLCLVYGLCPAGAAAASGAVPTEAEAQQQDARVLRALEDATPAAGPLADLARLLTEPAP